MSTKRKWIPIAVGIIVFLIFVAIGAAIFSVSYLRDHVQVAGSSEVDAVRAFDEVHARFPGPALIEIRDDEPVLANTVAKGPASKGDLTTLHILAWDPREQRLARIEVPFWLLRLKSGPIAFSSYSSGLRDDRMRLTVDDIDRRGPGIVVDVTDSRRNRGRALVWAE